MTANALKRFGFKPPEDAERIVSEARSACAALSNPNLNLPLLARRARDSISKLAEVTCALARDQRDRAERQETRKKWRDRAVGLLKAVGTALLGAMISQSVPDFRSPHNEPFSPAGQATVQILVMKSIQDAADAGVEQAQDDGL